MRTAIEGSWVDAVHVGMEVQVPWNLNWGLAASLQLEDKSSYGPPAKASGVRGARVLGFARLSTFGGIFIFSQSYC